MTTPQKSPAAETWQIGKVTVHRIAEVPLRGFGRWPLPQATPDVVAELTWLSPFYVDDDGQLLGSVHAFAVQIDGTRVLVDAGVATARTGRSPRGTSCPPRSSTGWPRRASRPRTSTW